jgi:F420-dependent oxidoreductase-like protein
MALKYGLILPQGWTMDLVRIKDPVEAYEAMTTVAKTAEEAGFESIWLVDHFHTVPQPTQEFTFECWTTTAALVRDTSRIRVGQMVTCNGYRNPALLAKMASTVDVMSHGRLNFGIGAGWYEHEYNAYNFPYPEAPERLRYLREALQVIHAMWEQEEATFEGKYYQVRGAINQPKGVQKPHIPILIGGGGEKVTLKLVAQYGDACNVNGSPEALKHKYDVIKQHCEKLGRDYNSIKRTATTLTSIAETDEAAVAQIPEGIRARQGERVQVGLVGSPATVRQRLAQYEEAGVQELLMTFHDALNLDAIRSFGRDFIG